MSIRQKREPIIKPAPQHKFDAVAFARKKLAENEERCKCIDKVESNSWESHGKYCPIWKNGRIAELEKALMMFDSAFIAEDIHDLGKAHEETRKVLKNGLRRNQKTMPM